MENTFKNLVEQKKIERKGAYYIYSIEGNEVNLGKGRAEAIRNLGNVLDPSRKSKQADALTENQGGNLEKDNPTEFEELLGMIEDIDPNQEGTQDLDIYINNVDSRLHDHPVIKAFPLSLRWRTKTLNVDSGSGLVKNQGYTVLRKDYPGLKDSRGNYIIKVSRDDTPNTNFWSVNDLVLCAIKKTQYEERTKKKEAKVMIQDKVIKEQRDNFAKDMSKVSDVNQVISSYNNINQGDRVNHIEASALKGVTAIQANAMFDNLTGDDALRLASQL
jgi:hypothetical protein